MLQWLIQLTRPYDSVVEPVARGRAQLIAAILVFVAPVGTVSVLVAYWVEDGNPLATGVQLVGMSSLAAFIPVARGPRYNRAVLGFWVLPSSC